MQSIVQYEKYLLDVSIFNISIFLWKSASDYGNNNSNNINKVNLRVHVNRNNNMETWSFLFKFKMFFNSHFIVLFHDNPTDFNPMMIKDIYLWDHLAQNSSSLFPLYLLSCQHNFFSKQDVFTTFLFPEKIISQLYCYKYWRKKKYHTAKNQWNFNGLPGSLMNEGRKI